MYFRYGQLHAIELELKIGFLKRRNTVAKVPIKNSSSRTIWASEIILNKWPVGVAHPLVMAFIGRFARDAISIRWRWVRASRRQWYNRVNANFRISFELQIEQIAQKAEKRARSRTYSIIRGATGSWVPLWSQGIVVCIHPPCTDESRIQLDVGDVVRVTRWKKWVFYSSAIFLNYLT